MSREFILTKNYHLTDILLLKVISKFKGRSKVLSYDMYVKHTLVHFLRD